MNNRLYFEVTLFDITLRFKLYDGIFDNFETIMNIDYSEQLFLKIQISNYLGLSNNGEESVIDFIISNKDYMLDKNIGLILSYYNGILYKVAYKSDVLADIEENVLIYDKDNGTEIIGSRLNLLYMVFNDARKDEILYTGKYNDYTENLLIDRRYAYTEYRYAIADETIFSENETMLVSTNTFYKINNCDEIEYIAKQFESTVNISIKDLKNIILNLLRNSIK